MIPGVRTAFNATFKQDYYKDLQQEVLRQFGEPSAFRISESPVFISRELGSKIFTACDAIIGQLGNLDFEAIRQQFVPESLQNPMPYTHPHFLAIDFGLCSDADGSIAPKLIELQAFPSLMYYQHFLGGALLRNYPNLPRDGFHYFFSGLDESTYKEEVGKMILGNEAPENVILLELFPEQQKTRIDFEATRQALGIEVVCLTKMLRQGNKLYYEKNGRRIPVFRIYNRVISDELQRYPELELEFKLQDEVEATWVTHPDWFFMISKCILPRLNHPSIPPSYYLNDIPHGIDYDEYVLKPLFSFAGKGINLNPDTEAVARIPDKHNYILQRKVNYAPLIRTNTDRNSIVEIRILYIWDEGGKKLKPVINLTRMGKGGLINVSHLTDDTWIGSSISFFED